MFQTDLARNFGKRRLIRDATRRCTACRRRSEATHTIKRQGFTRLLGRVHVPESSNFVKYIKSCLLAGGSTKMFSPAVRSFLFFPPPCPSQRALRAFVYASLQRPHRRKLLETPTGVIYFFQPMKREALGLFTFRTGFGRADD